MRIILKEIENRKRHRDSWGEQSYVVCPKCNKEIDFYYSKFAGVEWAKCRTKNCFDYKKSKLVLRKKPKLIKRKKPKLVKRKQLTLI